MKVSVIVITPIGQVIDLHEMQAQDVFQKVADLKVPVFSVQMVAVPQQRIEDIEREMQLQADEEFERQQEFDLNLAAAKNMADAMTHHMVDDDVDNFGIKSARDVKESI